MEEQKQKQAEEQTLEESDTDEIEYLEEEVKLMAQKIGELRETLPDQLKDTLSSILSAQRPPTVDHDDDSAPGPSDVRALVDSEDPEHTEKLQLIKQKISSNATAMPLLVKRMKDCISRIDQLDSFKQEMIHPAFTRK